MDGSIEFRERHAHAGLPVPPEPVSHPLYRAERALGRGGVDIVYLAHDLLLVRREVR